MMRLGLQTVSIRLLRHETWLRTEMRVRLHPKKVQQYAREKKQGANFPAPIVFVDPEQIYRTGDGFHRIEAEFVNGSKEVEVLLKAGTLTDAVLCNLKANRESQGLPFSPGDISKALKFVVTEPRFSNLNRKQIAELVGCSAGAVWQVRRKLGISDCRPIPIDMDEVFRRRANGESYREIGKALGVSGHCIMHRIKKGLKQKPFIKCPHCNGTGKVPKPKEASS